MRQKSRGFTLIELLVVISIVSLLSSVVLASLNAAREKGRVGAVKLFEGHSNGLVGSDAVAIWEFDECSGAVDRSGFGNDATLYGNATASSETPKGIGCSLALDGNYDYAIVPDSPSLDFGPGQDFSISYWVKTSSATGNPMSKKNTGNSDLGWGILGLSGYHALLFGNGTTNVGSVVITGINDGIWHQIFFSIDRDGRCYGYKDGKLAAQLTCSGWESLDLSNSLNLHLGANNSGSPVGYWLNGLLDEVRIYTKSLTAAEVGKLYASEAPRFDVAAR